MPKNWWTIVYTRVYELEFERLWISIPGIRQTLSSADVALQRRDLEAWLARTAEPRGSHLWIVRHEGKIELMLECHPEDCLVRLIWARILTPD